MFGLRLKGRPGRWSLRTRLLLPISTLVLLAVIGLVVIGDLAVRREVSGILDERGSAILKGVDQHVQQARRDSARAAGLIVARPELELAVEQGDLVSLERILPPLMEMWKLDRVAIYSGSGQDVLQLGRQGNLPDEKVIVERGLLGVINSSASIDDTGLVVQAAAPVEGHHGITGIVVVGKRLTGVGLQALRDQDGAELAMVYQGRVVDTTVTHPALRRALQAALNPATTETGTADGELEGFQFHATVSTLGADGRLIALVPARQLSQALSYRNQMVLFGAILLEAALLLVGLLVARSITRPLQAIVTATAEMVQGNYDRRAKPSPIRELNDLAKMVNYLAQDLEIQLAKLGRMAYRDPVSNLPNRSLFMERLTKALAKADQQGTAVAVMFLDLDNFKVINDSLGHQAGDQMLVAVAQRLRTSMRPDDTVARLGGDEFTILLENATDVEDATRLADRIAERFQVPFNVGGHDVFSTVSIGIALSTPGQTQPDELLRDADVAMYRAKTSGKAHYAVFDRSMNAQAMERLELELDMRRAIGQDEFRVYYQPIVQLETGKITEVEALVRWEHPQRGLVSPAQFIPLAEETGLIVAIGEWVLETACRQAVVWQTLYPNNAPQVMSVNLSARQFQQPKLVETVAEVLRTTGLEPHRLKLEITESVMMADMEGTIATLHKLRGLGARLAIDDFGTGYSSLAYLKRFPIDTLKIDKSFVNELGRDPESTAIVHAVLAFAKALSLTTTAEGVQTIQQLQHLRSLDCERGQGYFFARPLTSEALAALLESVPHWKHDDTWLAMGEPSLPRVALATHPYAADNISRVA
jgi:diguanylate cyclase (GGDEF)-like protein